MAVAPGGDASPGGVGGQSGALTCDGGVVRPDVEAQYKTGV